MNYGSGCDLCFYDLLAFWFNHFDTMFCKFKVVFVFFNLEDKIFFEPLVFGFFQFDQFATNMNLVMLDDKFEMYFWEFEVPFSFNSLQEEFDCSWSNNMS